jgi:hypothetical protein
MEKNGDLDSNWQHKGITTLSVIKTPICFTENKQKSPKILIITLTPGAARRRVFC